MGYCCWEKNMGMQRLMLERSLRIDMVLLSVCLAGNLFIVASELIPSIRGQEVNFYTHEIWYGYGLLSGGLMAMAGFLLYRISHETKNFIFVGGLSKYENYYVMRSCYLVGFWFLLVGLTPLNDLEWQRFYREPSDSDHLYILGVFFVILLRLVQCVTTGVLLGGNSKNLQGSIVIAYQLHQDRHSSSAIV